MNAQLTIVYELMHNVNSDLYQEREKELEQYWQSALAYWQAQEELNRW